MSSQRFGRRYYRSKALSPLGMPDPVIEIALEEKHVDHVQVAEAYEIRQQVYNLGAPEPAWRCLTTLPGVDRDYIYKAAAEAYDYKRFTTSPKLLVSFIRRIVPCFTDEQWRGMSTIPLVPIKRTHTDSRKWSFAAHDPTSRHTHEFAHSLVGSSYVLYQADRAVIARLLAEVFLSKMELPGRRRRDRSQGDQDSRES